MPAFTLSCSESDDDCPSVTRNGEISGKMFYEWINVFQNSRNPLPPIEHVDLSRDSSKVYFNANIFHNMLLDKDIKHVVIFFGCNAKSDQHSKLSVFACGVDQNCQIITGIYKGRDEITGEDNKVPFEELKKGQINWISRNLHMSRDIDPAPGRIDPYNEYNGYAHCPSYLKRCFFETDKPEPDRKYKKVAMYFGIDTRKIHRNTVVFVGIFENNQEDLPEKDAFAILVVDNGAQCCPIPDDPTPLLETYHA